MKTQEQLDLQTLHRARERLVGKRTALINQLRRILIERGIVAPQGRRKFEQRLLEIMEGEEGESMSDRIRSLINDMRTQWRKLDQKIGAFDAEFVAFAKESDEARRLTTIPGVGPIIASALVAAVGNAEAFEHGRDLATWLGLVPRQSTTGGKPRLLGISKRGNVYLRKQLIHGARAAIQHFVKQDTALGRWVTGMLARSHFNVVVTALANKLARISWVVLRRGQCFSSQEARTAVQ